MAALYPQTLSNIHAQTLRHHSIQLSPPQRRPQSSKQRFVQELSQCLCDFVTQLLPTPEELAVKEDVRKLLERLIRSIEPDSRLLSFGSTANGFSLRNSDMDLCCLIDSEDRLAASDLVTMVGDLLARETRFVIKPLPLARIPIVKLSLPPSPGLPFGIACDIGFENRLALENTRLLFCYAMIDPARVRTMVLFLKVWCKRRKINSPYKGTLSSYGYVLLVIYFLVHVKNPPVLPNLQQLPPLRPISQDETHLNGYNTWFFDDINLLRERWQSKNTETVAELLIDFFKFYSRDFAYNTGVVSIRSGFLLKEGKGWLSETDIGTARERNRLCIEDPFETDFNVARCVTRDGLYTIRGEFMRASRILASRPERAIIALAQLCEERKDEELVHASPSRPGTLPPRLSAVPPETPYNIHSSPMRPSGVRLPERLSPPETHHQPSHTENNDNVPQDRLVQPEHMAPRRGKWTSPPPPEAPEEERYAFENSLGEGLALATSSSDARESDQEATSSNNSEIQTDDEDRRSVAESDDVRSIRSYTESGTTFYTRSGPSPTASQAGSPQLRSYPRDTSGPRAAPRMAASHTEGGIDPRWFARLRGRPSLKQAPYVSDMTLSTVPMNLKMRNDVFVPPPRMETPRRSMSGPSRAINRLSMPTLPTAVTPVSIYPTRAQMMQQVVPQHNVFYETAPARDRLNRGMGSAYAMPVARLPAYGMNLEENAAFQYAHMHPMSMYMHDEDGELDIGPTPPVSTTPSQANMQTHPRMRSHAHSHSQATITAPTPPPTASRFPSMTDKHDTTHTRSRSRSRSKSRPRSADRSSRSPPPTYNESQESDSRCESPFASVSSASPSPPESSSSSQYASPLSTSPPSPMPKKETSPAISPGETTPDLAETKQNDIAIVETTDDDGLAVAAEGLAITR
ncbi:hypothetical protein EIP86_005705 [Pleurotus ostreatoroseus]|nr:hypothetical protein EIP86_005705 [Pleurotus ostreatoroseus]